MVNTKIKPLVESSLLATLTVLFALVSVYLPLIGFFLTLLMPLPIIFLGIRHGLKWSIMATVVAGLISIILMHPIYAIIMVISFGCIGIALGHAFHQEYSPTKSLICGAVAVCLSITLGTMVSLVALGINPITIQIDAVNKAASFFLTYNQPALAGIDLSALSEKIQLITKLFFIVLPAGFIISSIILSYINIMMTISILKKLGYSMSSFPPLRQLTLPGYFVLLYGLAMLLTYFGQVKKIDLFYHVGLNLQLLVNSFLLIQGLAISSYLANKYHLSKIVFIVIMFFIFSNEISIQVLILGGLFDLSFDYRKLRTSCKLSDNTQ